MFNELSDLYFATKKNNYDFFKKNFVSKFSIKLKFSKKTEIALPLKGYFYYIESGSLKESMVDSNGDLKTLKILTNNSIIYYPNSDGLDSLWILQTLTDVVVYNIPITELNYLEIPTHKIMYTNYNLNWEIYFLKWFYMSDTGEKRVMSAMMQILISTLNLSTNIENKKYQLPNYVTHELISEFTGTSRSYVTRVIKKLVEKRLLYNNHFLIIQNVDNFIEYLSR